MKLQSQQIYIRPFTIDDAQDLLALRVKNREFLKPFEPIMAENHFTLAAQQEAIIGYGTHWGQGTGYAFGIFLAESNQLVGRVNISNIARGAWQSCTIGYFLDQEMNGRGMMTEAVRLVIQFAFDQIDLHRVQASIMPRNQPSIRVVEKLGFHYEGLAKYYLRINGVWEDHNIYSMTREFWRQEC